MSWWTDIKDNFEKIATFGLIDPKSNREQQSMMNAQMKAYQEQTELAKKQLDEARATADVQKRRIEEKQIRSLRGRNRAQNTGMLGVGMPASDDLSTQLGG
jgi:outer membrane PBP1 activator LpoA protein